MEERPERIADYFVVVGLGKTMSPFERFPSDEIDLPPASLDPITDIVVIFKRSDETCPKGYECIETTPAGHSANLNAGNPFSGSIHLCYRRGRDKAPVIEISVFYMNQKQPPPAGHEHLAFSVGGRSADLNKGGTPTFLTVKRGMLFGHSAAITDICIIMPSKGEEPPQGYRRIPMDLNKGVMGPSLFLCYNTSLILPKAIAYTPELLSRYPLQDYPEFPLPKSVPLFCMPFGVSVEHWDRRAPFPLPTFLTFALTNAQGQCMYGAVVAFYEQMKEEETRHEMRKALDIGEQEVLYMSKCICILSHWPFFSAFKSFLSALYRLSISRNSPLPLERYIGNLMQDVPFPTLERPRVQTSLGSERIIFSLPVQTPLPLSVTTHWSLLSALDAENSALLLSLLLLEQRTVLHSSRPALLTCVGEALRSVLFPLSWQCTYIPMCPLAFASYMQAPIPFIIGIDSQFFDVGERPVGVCTVDLDANLISLSRDARRLLEDKPLPVKPLRLLKQSLKVLSTKVAVLNPSYEFAVEVAPMDVDASGKPRGNLETVDVEIRECFLRFLAAILANYRRCLRPLLSAPSERSRDTASLFDYQLFLKHCPASEGPFYQYLFDTQIFNAFIEQRSFAHAESVSLAFFDECTEKLQQDLSVQLINVTADVSRRFDLPTVVALPPDDTGLIKGKTYSYQNFPSLDLRLFHAPNSPVCRLPTMRFILPGSPLVARRTQPEKTKDRTLLERALRDDCLWPRMLLSHVCSLWYVLLPAHLSTHWNKMGVLSQALELLEEMRRKQALPSDEVCYRILMEQCVKVGRPALAVRVYHEMIRAGIQPNAITYGFYNKTVLEGAWPSCRHTWKVLVSVISACRYLHRRIGQNAVSDGDKPESAREPDFSSLTRQAPLSSRKSISALDVGLDGGDLAVGEGEGSLLAPGRRTSSHSAHLRRGSVYKLSTTMLPGSGRGDYVVMGDASYMADKSPLWGVGGERGQAGVWDYKGVHTRLSRPGGVAEEELVAPCLTVELSSCTQCSGCKRLLYDEEIMANWSDSDADYKTSCPYCHTKLVASLGVQIKQMLPFVDQPTPSQGKASQSNSTIVEEIDGQTSLTPPTPSSPSRSRTWDRRLGRRKTDDPVPGGSSSPSGDVAGLQYLEGVASGSLGVAHAGHASDPLQRRAVDAPPTTAAASTYASAEDGASATGAGQRSLGLKSLSEGGPLRTRGESPTASSTNPTSLGISPRLASKSPGEDAFANVDGPVNRRRTKTAPSRPLGGVEIMVEDTSKAASSPSTPERSIQTVAGPGPSASDGGREESDFGGVIARMRARGHRRAASAPLHSQPSPLPLRAVPSGGEEKEEEEKRKPRYHTKALPPLVVPYLNPVVLRKEVESLISLQGAKYLEKEEIVREKPIIYWNLVWYFSRLQLPTYLPLFTLWAFTRSNQELGKQYVQLKIELRWDAQVPGVQEPLYLMWLGKVPRVVQLSPNHQFLRRDSEVQLQSLVARTQCGDLVPVLRSLLEDRKARDGHLTTRSLYRETLFLKCVLSDGNVDIERFDREYLQSLQRLPRELSSATNKEDLPPGVRAAQCRRHFGCLHLV